MTNARARQLWQRIALVAMGAALVGGCAPAGEDAAAAERLADPRGDEKVLARANLGFELSDPVMFANAFAPDAVYELAAEAPVFGYAKLRLRGDATDIRTITRDRLERARTTRIRRP